MRIAKLQSSHENFRFVGNELDCKSKAQNTRNAMLLDSVPLGVVTWTVPVDDPFGTVVVISVAEIRVKAAVLPLKVTLVAPVRFVPSISTVVPG
jgi:hypothetical protein